MRRKKLNVEKVENVEKGLLGELLDLKIVVKFLDVETQTPYLGLSPGARREILQLPAPKGFTLEGFEDFSINVEKVDSQQELTKMSGKYARKGFRTSPKGQIEPVCVPLQGLIDIEEGEK